MTVDHDKALKGRFSRQSSNCSVRVSCPQQLQGTKANMAAALKRLTAECSDAGEEDETDSLRSYHDHS